MKTKINDIEFLVNNDFNPTFWDYLSLGLWESNTFEVIDNFVSENSTVIDIGSWIGPLSLYMAGKGAQVYAIEPDPIAFKEFEKNLKLNPTLSQRIFPFKCAIVPKSEHVQLFARKHLGDSSSSMLHRIADSNESIDVKGLSLEEFVDNSHLNQVDFIKIDIEGGEFELLPSITLAVEKLGFPTIFISFHYSYLSEFFHNQQIRSRHLSKLLLKIEKIANCYLFRSKMISVLNNALKLSENYNYKYTEHGEEIDAQDLTAGIMINNQMNLILSNKKWCQ